MASAVGVRFTMGVVMLHPGIVLLRTTLFATSGSCCVVRDIFLQLLMSLVMLVVISHVASLVMSSLKLFVMVCRVHCTCNSSDAAERCKIPEFLTYIRPG